MNCYIIDRINLHGRYRRERKRNHKVTNATQLKCGISPNPKICLCIKSGLQDNVLPNTLPSHKITTNECTVTSDIDILSMVDLTQSITKKPTTCFRPQSEYLRPFLRHLPSNKVSRVQPASNLFME